MPRKTRKSVKITNPAATRLPSGYEIHVLPGADPVRPLPRKRAGEVIRSSRNVRVTNSGAQAR